MKRIILFIIGRSAELVEQPLFNFASITIIIASIGILFTNLFSLASLRLEMNFLFVNQLLLQLIAIETGLRVINAKKRRYLRTPAFVIDLLTLAPLGVNILTQYSIFENITGIDFRFNPEQPGFILFQGIRSLRLLPATLYFHRQRQLATYGLEKFSPLKLIIFSRLTLFTSTMILILGLVVAIVYGNSLETKRNLREQQVLIQARSHGVLQTRLVFESIIPGVYVTQNGIRKFIPGTHQNPADITNSHKYIRDYKQFDEPQPGQSIIISYKDLNIEQSRIELLILITGMLLVILLLGILNHYINTLITNPLEVSRRTVQLRLSGEEILTTEIKRTPYTEITRSINDTDRLYQKLRAPARKLITQNLE